MKREVKKAENDRTGRVGQSRQERGDSHRIEGKRVRGPNGQKRGKERTGETQTRQRPEEGSEARR